MKTIFFWITTLAFILAGCQDGKIQQPEPPLILPASPTPAASAVPTRTLRVEIAATIQPPADSPGEAEVRPGGAFGHPCRRDHDPGGDQPGLFPRRVLLPLKQGADFQGRRGRVDRRTDHPASSPGKPLRIPRGRSAGGFLPEAKIINSGIRSLSPFLELHALTPKNNGRTASGNPDAVFLFLFNYSPPVIDLSKKPIGSPGSTPEQAVGVWFA